MANEGEGPNGSDDDEKALRRRIAELAGRLAALRPIDQRRRSDALSDSAKEKIKLRAAYFNGMAIGLFTAGVLTPLLSAVIDPQLTTNSLAFVILAIVVCFSASVVLHPYARRQLEELDQ